MKIKELFFSSYVIRATFPAAFFSDEPSLMDLFCRTLLRRIFSVRPFFGGHFLAYYFFQKSTYKPSFSPIHLSCSHSSDTSSGRASLRSHKLTMQSIPVTHLVTVSHSGHINSSCSQFRRNILWPCLTSVTSTRRVVNSGDTSSGRVSIRSHQLAMQSIPVTHLVIVSHSNHINSLCSQFRRHILWPSLTPVTSTCRVVNSNDFSNNPRSSIRLSTYLTSLVH